MPANKFATIRYHVIDKMLRNKYKPYPSVEDIMDKCSDVLLKPISKSSIEKDVRAMKNDEALGYFAPIEYSRIHRGYFYSSSDYSIDKVPLNEDEIEAVQFATNILTQFKNVAIFKDYQNAIEKVLDKVNLTSGDSPKEKEYIQFENIPTVSGNEFLAPILNAIRKRNIIGFDYHSFKTEGSTQREVEPYLLKEHNNRWYLICREKGAEIYKVFGLERMNEVRLQKDEFIRSTEFVAEEFFKNSLGITANPAQNPEWVKFECNKVLIQYIDSQPIHSSQKIELTPNGGIVSLYIIVTFELIQMLAGWSNEVTVREPKSLIVHLIERHQKAIKNYT
ncbi:MAG: putative DNA-binding transcriptional regulator YafY [Dokdonia sp.]|jgi:predicted DNA-binding transcriptional regulator YafY